MVVEVILGVFLEVLFKKLGSELIMVFARREKIYKLLERWSKKWLYIQAVIQDAQDKQLTDQTVKLWLEHLRDLAYDLDDVLDEISTQAMKQESECIEERSRNVWKFIPSYKDYTLGAIRFKKRIRSKIEEISARLEDIVKNGHDLKLSPNVGVSPSNQTRNRLPSTSVVEANIIGRKRDKEAVTRLLVGNEKEVSVIPIVGMGGVGKTTLVHLIYNDVKINNTFGLKAWICVSDVFDVLAITKAIFHSVTRTSAESKDLNMLQESLQKTFSHNKFLLILDDVWNKDYVKWEGFLRPFLVGLPGSKVLVTTRDNGIAKMVGSVPSYHVEFLTDDNCLSLLAQHALGRDNFDQHPNFKKIGEEFASKCKGLPLAAKTLGGLLRCKESLIEWEDVLQSKIWDLADENNILPVLRLSYHHLPAHLRHLFAYCSIFPKDYQFDKYELVLLWVGEGFIQQQEERKTKEQLGFEYFDELLSRSFFQPLSSGSASQFVMHDLVNDLAQFVSGGVCYKLDEKVETSDEYKISEKARHASFIRHEYEVFRKFKGFYQVKGLRTFLPMPVQNINVWPPFYLSNTILNDLLPELRSLRVLSLSGYSITELPSPICSLIHLRYLNLSGTSIVSLPDSLSDLYNLETLSIRNCRFISKLPPALGDLVNLRHLDNSNTDQLKELPVEIGKLGSLQSLPKIVLNKDGCGLGLRELRNFELLRGTISLLELQNVRTVEDAKEASLGRKHEIEELHLSWTKDTDDSRDAHFEEDVLDALQPHQNLTSLNIEYYGGTKFPSWIGDPSFSNIFSVSISGCTECTSLPPLGLLPELKHLHIEDVPKIKHIGVEFFGKHVVGVIAFPKLETLRLHKMPLWEKWSGYDDESRMSFPCLDQLSMFRCPKLVTVSPLSLPAALKLDVSECSIEVLESFCNLESLNHLKVESVAGLSNLPRALVQSIVKVEVLECCNCDELLSLWPNGVTPQHLTSLRRLIVADCKMFVSSELPQNLKSLELLGCASLKSLPNDLSSLRDLTELIIKNCPKIVNFSEQGIPQVLKRLEILSCKALKSLPIDISDLERLEIKECRSLENWPRGGNFADTLKKLSIKNCNKLEPVSGEMFPPNRGISLEELCIWDWPNFSSMLYNMHSFSLLTELYLSDCGLDYFPDLGLPPYLRTLSVEHCSKLRILPMQIANMLFIKSLEIRSCRKLKKFPSCDFPPNLSSLRIWDSRKLKPLSQWGLHRLSSLTEFSICGGFPELKLLGNDHGLFPPSLVRFSIARFPKLCSLSNVLEDLTSLQHLSIVNCTSITVLPSANLLEKLWYLEISECPLLEQRCLKSKEGYWPKISGIPCVIIRSTKHSSSN